MNIKILLSIGLCLVGMTAPLVADNLSAREYADKYFADFNTWQGDGLVYMYGRFDHGVPASMQPDVLDRIFDRACSAQPKRNAIAIHQVLKYIEELHPEITLSQRFDTNLSALTKDQNYTTRRDTVEFMGRMNRGDHTLIAAALNDPKEDVRGAAINAIRGQPDAEATFQKFIQDHQNDPDYHTSVMYAKNGLDAIHAKAPGQ